VGAAVITWIRERAAAFRRAVSDPQLHRGGYSAFGFLTWLDNGSQPQRILRPSAITQQGVSPGVMGQF
jgi:hypothetical protein